MCFKQITIGILRFLFFLCIGVYAGFVWGDAKESKPRVVYPKKTQLDFEGAQIEGEIQNPGEFYFEHRPEEKFDSLIKRRKNFHREMMRDVVFSK